jgi:hypothetical protein
MSDSNLLLPAAYRYVMAQASVQALITDGTIGKDTVGGAYASGWVFSGSNDGIPPRNVEGSEQCAILFMSYSHWSSAVRHHSGQFPILTVSIFADPDRDDNDSPIAKNAESKAKRVWDVIDPLFHDPRNVVHWFDTLPVISTVQGSPLSILDIPDGDGAVRGTARYNLHLY